MVLSLSQLHNYTAFELICTHSGLHLHSSFLPFQPSHVINGPSFKFKVKEASYEDLNTECHAYHSEPCQQQRLSYLEEDSSSSLLVCWHLTPPLPCWPLVSSSSTPSESYTQIRVVVSWSQNYLWSNKADSDWNKRFCWAARRLASQQLLKECGDQTWAHTVKPAREERKRGVCQRYQQKINCMIAKSN